MRHEQEDDDMYCEFCDNPFEVKWLEGLLILYLFHDDDCFELVCRQGVR